MCNQNKSKVKFRQEDLIIGNEDEMQDYYLIIIELHDDKPVSSIIVKVPQPFLRVYANPYILN